jgi:hypothetical protein
MTDETNGFYKLDSEQFEELFRAVMKENRDLLLCELPPQ